MELKLLQIGEGSLIINRMMGVKVEGRTVGQYKYCFKLYEGKTLKQKTPVTQVFIQYFRVTDYGDYYVEVEVYKNKEKVKTMDKLRLDFLEDFVVIKDTSIDYKKGQLMVAVTTELDLPKEYYAYYLKKNQKVIEKVPYSVNKNWQFSINEPGRYCVQVFVRLIKNSGREDKVITHTDEIVIQSLEGGE